LNGVRARNFQLFSAERPGHGGDAILRSNYALKAIEHLM
jgi:hypothetical protein